jgi:DNA mismatch endonuclease, patch repair protein
MITMKVPRYSRFRSTSVLASDIKKRNRARDTKAELILRREIWRRGLRYRLHVTMPGKPDLVFTRSKVVIFCDGDFWHGRFWARRREKLARGANAAYWIPKIEANIARDRRVSSLLRRQGWHVIRVWETDVLEDVAVVADRICSFLQVPRSRSG